jgi:hypothetical protein
MRWENLDESIGKLLLVVLVGGGAVYGLTKFINAPPLLRQKSQVLDGGQNQYSRAAQRQLEAQLREIQEQQSEALRNSMEVGRSAMSP